MPRHILPHDFFFFFIQFTHIKRSPVVSIRSYAEYNAHDREDSDETWTGENLIVQTEAIVIPLAVTGAIQFQGVAAVRQIIIIIFIVIILFYFSNNSSGSKFIGNT